MFTVKVKVALTRLHPSTGLNSALSLYNRVQPSRLGLNWPQLASTSADGLFWLVGISEHDNMMFLQSPIRATDPKKSKILNFKKGSQFWVGKYCNTLGAGFSYYQSLWYIVVLLLQGQICKIIDICP